jgi:hypothetical protein
VEEETRLTRSWAECELTVMARPQTLAEVASIVRANPPDYTTPINEFCDEFYLDHPDKTAQQRRIDVVPEPVGDALADAWIGAVGEHLALRWGLKVPAWTRRAAHSALEDPHFVPASKAMRGVVIESPPSFRSRLIFTLVEPLDTPNFPAGVLRAKVPLEWPPPKETEEERKNRLT